MEQYDAIIYEAKNTADKFLAEKRLELNELKEKEKERIKIEAEGLSELISERMLN